MSAPAPPVLAPAVDAGLVEQGLLAALERLDPETRHLCGYALGLCDADGRPDRPAGKGVRGRLALLSARGAGAPPGAGVPAAVAVELVHNFSLVHDDLMDGDRLRRHRPTVWAQFGAARAILAGDALLGLAAEVLEETGDGWAVRCLAATVRRLIAGQMADLRLSAAVQDVPLAAVVRMAADKTASLLSCSAALGAVVVGATPGLALGLASYGDHLGRAFQLRDDLLGIWGEPGRTGKPVGADLAARKRSLPVAAALAGDHPAAQRLAAYYRRPPGLRPATESEHDLREVAGWVEEAGGRRWAEREARRELDAALAVLEPLPVPSDVAAELQALALALAGRDR